MRSAATLAAILVFGGGDAFAADCPTPTPRPTRTGTLVTIVVDFCKPAPSPTPAPPPAPSAAPGAAPRLRSGGTTQAIDLYRDWQALTKSSGGVSAAPTPAAAPQRAAIPFVPEFFDLIDGPETKELKGVRIDERDRVAIALRHFNFVNFGAEYTIEKTVIEAYVTLNTLWSQALGLGPTLRAASAGNVPCPTDATFEQCVVDWMWALVLTNRSLERATGLHKDRVALDDAMITTLTTEADGIRNLRAQLLRLQAETLTRKPESMQEIEWYKQVQAAHDKLMAQIDAFAVLAELTRKGQIKNVDKQAAGTLVTVRITAKNAVGNPASKVEIQYFVHSRYPLTFHGGYLYSSFKEVKFEQVRTVAGADLFAQVQQPSSVSTYAAFLSYEIVGTNTGRYKTGVLATLGTDFKDPGKRLFIGGSVRLLSRVFVGGGVVSAKATEGVNPVVEQIGSQLARELFGTLTTRREWKPFFHVSFGVFN
jgi:hypothetical protein